MLIKHRITSVVAAIFGVICLLVTITGVFAISLKNLQPRSDFFMHHHHHRTNDDGSRQLAVTSQGVGQAEQAVPMIAQPMSPTAVAVSSSSSASSSSSSSSPSLISSSLSSPAASAASIANLHQSQSHRSRKSATLLSSASSSAAMPWNRVNRKNLLHVILRSVVVDDDARKSDKRSIAKLRWRKMMLDNGDGYNWRGMLRSSYQFAGSESRLNSIGNDHDANDVDDNDNEDSRNPNILSSPTRSNSASFRLSIPTSISTDRVETFSSSPLSSSTLPSVANISSIRLRDPNHNHNHDHINDKLLSTTSKPEEEVAVVVTEIESSHRSGAAKEVEEDEDEDDKDEDEEKDQLETSAVSVPTSLHYLHSKIGEIDHKPQQKVRKKRDLSTASASASNLFDSKRHVYEQFTLQNELSKHKVRSNHNRKKLVARFSSNPKVSQFILDPSPFNVLGMYSVTDQRFVCFNPKTGVGVLKKCFDPCLCGIKQVQTNNYHQFVSTTNPNWVLGFNRVGHAISYATHRANEFVKGFQFIEIDDHSMRTFAHRDANITRRAMCPRRSDWERIGENEIFGDELRRDPALLPNLFNCSRWLLSNQHQPDQQQHNVSDNSMIIDDDQSGKKMNLSEAGTGSSININGKRSISSRCITSYSKRRRRTSPIRHFKKKARNSSCL